MTQKNDVRINEIGLITQKNSTHIEHLFEKNKFSENSVKQINIKIDKTNQNISSLTELTTNFITEIRTDRNNDKLNRRNDEFQRSTDKKSMDNRIEIIEKKNNRIFWFILTSSMAGLLSIYLFYIRSTF